VRALSEEVDISHADGRARFAEAARPLVEKLPPGVYYDQVIQRIAGELGRSQEKLEEIWAEARKRARVPDSPPPVAETAKAPRIVESAGRGTLMRQAIDALLRFPSIAGTVTRQQVESLAKVDERGIELLRELLQSLQTYPAQSAGQVIQRFEGRPEQDQLSRLLQKEDLVQSPAQASTELNSAIEKLVEASDRRRFEELSKIAAWGPDAMTEEQRLEFKSLVTRNPIRKPPS
jgi:DNA primase